MDEAKAKVLLRTSAVVFAVLMMAAFAGAGTLMWHSRNSVASDAVVATIVRLLATGGGCGIIAFLLLLLADHRPMRTHIRLLGWRRKNPHSHSH